MSILAQVLAMAVALVHLLAFVWESVLFLRPGVHRDIFQVRTDEVPPVRMWSFNVGFYNLFLAAGLVSGVIAYHAGQVLVGRTLVLYISAFAVLAGVVLFVSDRLAMSRPKGAGVAGSISQALPAAATIVAMLV